MSWHPLKINKGKQRVAVHNFIVYLLYFWSIPQCCIHVILILAINSFLWIERWFIRCVRKINKYYLATDVEHLSELTVANKVYYFPVWVMKYSRRKTFATRFITIYNLYEKTKTNISKRQQRKKRTTNGAGKVNEEEVKKSMLVKFVACLTFLMFVFFSFYYYIRFTWRMMNTFIGCVAFSWFPNVVRVVYLTPKWQVGWVVAVRLIGSWYVNRTHIKIHTHTHTCSHAQALWYYLSS